MSNKLTNVLLGVMVSLWVLTLGTVGLLKFKDKFIQVQINNEIAKNQEILKKKAEEVAKDSVGKYNIPKLPKIFPKKETVLPDVKSWAYNIKNPRLDMIKNTNFDLVVMDMEIKKVPISREKVESLKIKKNGSKRTIVAYMSLGYAEDYRSYWDKAWATKKPAWLGEPNRVWKGNYLVNDVNSNEWMAIAKGLVDKAVETGYDGIMIDGVVSYKAFKNAGEQKTNMIKFVDEISKYAKSKNANFLVLTQDADDLLDEAKFVDSIDGMIKQGLIYSPLSNGVSGKKNNPVEVKKDIDALKKFKDSKKLVLVVEYVSKMQWAEAKKTIMANGFVGYSAPLQLDVIRIQ